MKVLAHWCPEHFWRFLRHNRLFRLSVHLYPTTGAKKMQDKHNVLRDSALATRLVHSQVPHPYQIDEWFTHWHLEYILAIERAIGSRLFLGQSAGSSAHPLIRSFVPACVYVIASLQSLQLLSTFLHFSCFTHEHSIAFQPSTQLNLQPVSYIPSIVPIQQWPPRLSLLHR